MTEIRTETYVKYSSSAKSDRCVVLDMDDTLCFYDTALRLSQCDKFLPRSSELSLAIAAQENGIDVVIATARPCWAVGKTKMWLKEHGLNVRALYVKNRNNYNVVAHDLKAEMLKDIQQTYNIVGFYDDSPYNIAAAQALGIPATHIPGNEEYWSQRGAENGWVLPFTLN